MLNRNNSINIDEFFKLANQWNTSLTEEQLKEWFYPSLNAKKNMINTTLLKSIDNTEERLPKVKRKLESKNTKDYYFREGSTTILNSLDAAISKCEEIVAELKQGEKFFDNEFGPRDDMDEEGNRKSLYTTGEAPKGYVKAELIWWLRPNEMEENTGCLTFRNENIHTSEVLQGALEDCWFIGALSLLSSRKDLLNGDLSWKISKDFACNSKTTNEMIKGVYPQIFRWYKMFGIYVFRFFKNFKWRYVIVDERIPCYKASKTPIFAWCKDSSELWVSLIEKAYAKLHYCYESLISGFIDDGLSDLTGFASEKINIQGN